MIETVLEHFATFVLYVIETTGYAGIFILMALESANVPIPSEVTMPFVGFLASRGVFDFWVAVTVGAVANVTGSLFSYWLAVKWGEKALRVLEKLRLFTVHDYEKGKSWVIKYGQTAAFFSRLLPVVRTFISFPAGMFRMELKKFAVFTFVGSFGWSWFLTYLGYQAGENWNFVRPYFHKFDIVMVIVIVIGFTLLVLKRLRKKDF